MPNQLRPYSPHDFAGHEVEQAEFDLWQVFNGGLAQARVGRIPRWLANSIKAHTTIVMLTADCAQKIRWKEKRNISWQELLAFASSFHDGEHAIRDTRTDIAFVFKSPHADRGMINGVIHATRDGSGLYIKTMYPIRGNRLKAMQAKGFILRGHRV